ncbi:MAG: HAD family hydrolase [Planctomycetota bacterium]
MTAPLRIAMWSGPRTISTALLRSFANRADTVGVDEPFYAHYLDRTGKQHPGRDEVLAAQPVEADDVVKELLLPLPRGRTVQYQKQMAHHLLPSVPLEWLTEVRSAFLLRDPAHVIASYVRVVPDASPADLGMPQMAVLFEREWERTGEVPPVVDSADLLRDPRGVLTRLCERLGIPFDERQLAWSPGPRPWDGVWARYWYAKVEQSTGFGPHRDDKVELPGRFAQLHEECERHYRQLWEHRIRP